MGHSDELTKNERFAFGQNWAHYLKTLDEERIQAAEASLLERLGQISLKGKTFLDAGCGSGLFSLAARRLGAKVHSFDYDPESVACASELKRCYFPDDPEWVIDEASVLDQIYLAKLGEFDIVYSWGVLHHTGHMFDGLRNVSNLVVSGGVLFVAIYNNLGSASRRWLFVKRTYCRLPTFLRLPYALMIIIPVQIYSFFVYAAQRKVKLFMDERFNYGKRGMNWWYDQIDWIGGYPYEDAKPEEIFDCCKAAGFELERLYTCGSRIGCNEFVFMKHGNSTNN